MRGVPREQRDDDEHERLAGPVLGERQRARVAHEVGRQHDAQRHEEAGDQHEHRPHERGEHAAGAEQGPEDRGVGTPPRHRFHGLSIQAIANSTKAAAAAAAKPVRVIVLAATRWPPTYIAGIVLGMISNQLVAW